MGAGVRRLGYGGAPFLFLLTLLLVPEPPHLQHIQQNAASSVQPTPPPLLPFVRQPPLQAEPHGETVLVQGMLRGFCCERTCAVVLWCARFGQLAVGMFVGTAVRARSAGRHRATPLPTNE